MLFSRELAEWSEAHGVSLVFMGLGEPAQIACIERFDHTFREEVRWVPVFHIVGGERYQ